MYLVPKATWLPGSSPGIFKNLIQNKFNFVFQGFSGSLKTNCILKMYPDVPGAQGDHVIWIISWNIHKIYFKTSLILFLGSFWGC